MFKVIKSSTEIRVRKKFAIKSDFCSIFIFLYCPKIANNPSTHNIFFWYPNELLIVYVLFVKYV